MESINTPVKVFKNKLFRSNSYLLSGNANDTCLVIDPGLDSQALIDFIAKLRLKPIAILSTHGHFDHIGSVKNIQKEYNADYYLHESDLKMSQSANFFLQIARINQRINTPIPDFLFKGKHETINIGDFLIEIHNFPGHSSGSCVFKFQDYLFTGDILYKNGLGPETIPKEDKKLLKESIMEIFSRFSDKCIVFPGHGSPEYLGMIKQNNLELRKFIMYKSDENK